MRASQSLPGTVVYLVSADMQHVEVELGLVDQIASLIVTAFHLSGGLLFFAMVRRCRDAEPIDDCIGFADRARYRAKVLGRNRAKLA